MRAILVALGIGVAVTSAAALDIASAGPIPQPLAHDELVNAVRTRDYARAQQRARIEDRYQIDREACAALRGLPRDKCFVQAHAAKGRAMLEAAAPYEARY